MARPVLVLMPVRFKASCSVPDCGEEAISVKDEGQHGSKGETQYGKLIILLTGLSGIKHHQTGSN